MKKVLVTRKKFLNKIFILLSSPFLLSSYPALISRQKSFISDSQGGQEISDRDKITEKLKNKIDPLIWLFTGDSITHGAKHTHGYRSYPEIFAERIRWELGRTRDIIINTGISGNTTRVISEDFDWRIGQFKPNIVSLMIGTNDCATGRIDIKSFEENLNMLAAKIRDIGAIPVLHTPNPIITEKAPERIRLSDYVSVIRSVSLKNKIILVDNYSYWSETLQQGKTDVYKEWLNDPLHPDGDGHSEIARLMFKELAIFDRATPTCGGPYYEGEH
ncbi:MAG TPA: SGNH/GDSL hydrolase family protein [Bacteroidales bacterium]|nr:SGNH/GDSL hydrolase family protein [Bacteroidales bacterium]